VMGTFILWFGWYGFNPGSTCGLVDESADTAAIAYVNTMVCPVFAAITLESANTHVGGGVPKKSLLSSTLETFATEFLVAL